MNAPVALKIRSRDVVHKSDVGGVAFNLTSPAEVAAAAARMNEKILQALPKARLEGFIVQEMIHRPSAYELIAGVSTDPTFGPVILFGQGGTAVEIVRDKSLELPPLKRTSAIGGSWIGQSVSAGQGSAVATSSISSAAS